MAVIAVFCLSYDLVFLVNHKIYQSNRNGYCYKYLELGTFLVK